MKESGKGEGRTRKPNNDVPVPHPSDEGVSPHGSVHGGATQKQPTDMNVSKRIQTGSIAAGLVFSLLTSLFTPSAHANVYATDIKLNGGPNGLTNASGTSVSIS